MKPNLQWLLVVGGGIFVWASCASAQSTLTPAEYNALVQQLETTTPQPASEAPLVGNFYTLTHGESWPPLPADTMGLPFWNVQGWYILDDRNFDYSANHAEFGFGGLFPTNGGSGGSGGSGGFGPDFIPQYTSNDLYLVIEGVTSNVASLEIHQPPGVTEGVYNLLYTTNPATPLPWEWLLQTAPGQTNLLVTNASDPLGFYRLGTPSYWLAFPFMINNNGGETFSLYITSPVGATGTVKIANRANGPVLTVANTNSDPAVLGTYVLTNADLSPTSYGLNGATVSNYYVKGPYVAFYDNAFETYGDGAFGWVLANSTSNYVLYYGTYGVFLLNDVTWGQGLDANYISPTTSCAVVPSVQSFSVAAGSATSVPIPNSIMMNPEDTLDTNTAIAVTADGPISVYAVKYEQELTAAFTVQPASMLGTNYCVLARPSLIPISDLTSSGQSDLAIVATADNTSVRIVPSTNSNLAALSGTNVILLTLQAGQSYQVLSADNLGDVTGTVITSDKPIAVFAGVTDAYVPTNSTGDDNPLIQEQFPVEEWGTNALALSFAGRTGGDSYRVLPAQNATSLYTNGVLTATNLQAGTPYDYIIDGGVQFTANKPIQVAHLSNGALFGNPLGIVGDPCEILVRPTSFYQQTNVLVSLGTNAGDFDQNFLNIIAPQLAITNVFLDGTNIGSTNFITIPGSGYYGARLAVTKVKEVHQVSCSLPVGVEAYGSGFFDVYGYFSGPIK